MRDPYKILGVSKEAGNDDIKKVYRQLSRKYHPDTNINNPDKESAEAKFKEIQEAYKQIITERENSEDAYSYSRYGDFGAGERAWKNADYDDTELQRLKASERYVINRQYKEALNILNTLSCRTALWYYYHAVANYGLENYIMAVEDAENALKLEPDNIEYQRLYNQMKSTGQWYRNKGTEYGFPTESFGDCCIKILLFNCICGCCLK